MHMIKKLFFGALLMPAPFLVVSAQGDNNFTITGSVRGMDLQHVYLTYFSNGRMETDTGVVINDQYTLTGHLDMGVVAMLTAARPDAIPSPANTLSVFVAPSGLVGIRHEGSFSNAIFTGSAANTEYHKVLDNIRQLKDEKKALEDYMKENPSSPIFVFAFSNYIGDPRSLKAADVPRVRSLFNMLPDSIRERASSKAFAQQLDKLVTFSEGVTVGREAPDFTQNDTAGRPVSLSSFRGKYVLLDFWASWCMPCREENPTVVKAYRKYHDKGFEILSVSLDNNAGAWRKAIRQDQLTWTHVSDLKYWDNALVKTYGVQGVPQNFLIDPNGKIIARGLRGVELEQKLSEIYKN